MSSSVIQKNQKVMLNKYKNVASFQFVDAINTILTNKYGQDCSKFSLRDKAHIRNLISELDGECKDLDKQTSNMKAKISDLKNPLKVGIALDQENAEIRT